MRIYSRKESTTFFLHQIVNNNNKEWKRIYYTFDIYYYCQIYVSLYFAILEQIIIFLTIYSDAPAITKLLIL